MDIRINKYLRDKGFGSRREIDQLISSGAVFINGMRAELGTLVKPSDKVDIRRKTEKKYIYLAYSKPRGLATQAPHLTESVITKFRMRGVFPIGRLDKESEGLMILTNDGRLTTKLVGGESQVEKEYVVKVRERLREGIATILKRGMNTKSLGQLLPAPTYIVDSHTLRIVLREGKRHQIRIMLADLGYTIERLTRVRIGTIKIGKLKSGESRPLSSQEIKALNIAP